MENCLFCKIAAGQIPSSKVYEDEDFLAFRDIAPKAPVHILIIPKKHLADLASCSQEDATMLGRLNLLAVKIAEDQGIAQSGFRLLTNCRDDSGQEVAHLHFHLIGGRVLGDFCEKQQF